MVFEYFYEKNGIIEYVSVGMEIVYIFIRYVFNCVKVVKNVDVKLWVFIVCGINLL